MNLAEHKFPSTEELVTALANEIDQGLTSAVETKGYASLVVSGGSTPKALFEALSKRPMPWHKITITLTDERWVDPTSSDSNEAMVRTTLLQHHAKAATFVPLKQVISDINEAQNVCNQAITNITRPFDFVILGMGMDGHTASLFPDVSEQALNTQTKAYCLPIIPEHAPHQRMTLTLKALLDSNRIVLHITGEEKWQVYQQALQTGAVELMPIRAFLRQDILPVDVFWNP